MPQTSLRQPRACCLVIVRCVPCYHVSHTVGGTDADDGKYSTVLPSSSACTPIYSNMLSTQIEADAWTAKMQVLYRDNLRGRLIPMHALSQRRANTLKLLQSFHNQCLLYGYWAGASEHERDMQANADSTKKIQTERADNGPRQ